MDKTTRIKLRTHNRFLLRMKLHYILYIYIYIHAWCHASIKFRYGGSNLTVLLQYIHINNFIIIITICKRIMPRVG